MDRQTPQTPKTAVKAPTRKIRLRPFWRDTIFMFVVALAVVVLLRGFVFEIAVVEGPSMDPTLHTDQKVLVLKLPRLLKKTPKHGEIIVTHYPKPHDKDGELFIKRVVALPGDILEIRDGIVYVNGEVNAEGYHEATHQKTFPPTEIEEGQIFVMGDNRAKSFDCQNFGPIDMDLLLGRAYMVLFPLNEMHVLKHHSD